MPNTFKLHKGAEDSLHAELLAPGIAELALMTSKQQKKRVKKYIEALKEISIPPHHETK